MTIQILIVDDKEQVRKDLRTLLTLTGEIEIVGEADDGNEAVRQVEALQPDVILLDLEMPIIDGYQIASQVKKFAPSCRVIVLTVHDYPAARDKAFQSGADSYIVKGNPIEELIQAILGRMN